MTDFQDATVYVRRVTEKDPLFAASQASSTSDNSLEASQDARKDPDFVQVRKDELACLEIPQFWSVLQLFDNRSSL